MGLTTEELYNESSMYWQRTEPVLLSDFTARPFLLNWCEPVDGLQVLDLGCGEGYFARSLKRLGASSILGIDISPEMIRGAVGQDSEDMLGIRYLVGDASSLCDISSEHFDLCVAVFLFNYLSLEQTNRAIAEVYRLLRPGGRFIFAVPHPSLAFLGDNIAPFYFDPELKGYFSGRDCQFEGEIWRKDGQGVRVRCIHKNFEDYFNALAAAGFSCMPQISELRATEEHLQEYSQWLEPLRDKPLHLAFQLVK